MSGNKVSLGHKGTGRRQGRTARATLVVALLCLLASAASLTGRLPRPSREPFTPAATTAARQTGLQLSREYIYAGGRLVATEGPTTAPTPPPPPGPAPTGLAASFDPAAGRVLLSWSAPAPASVSGYTVERRPAGGQFAPLGQAVIGTTFADHAVKPGRAYLYRVRAHFQGGGSSDYSNSDLATVVAFADDPLVSASESPAGATTIRALHLAQLREAVNAVRELAGHSAIAWTFAAQPGSPVKLEDLSELRAGLGQARETLGLPAVPYTDPEPARGATPVRKAHVQELREAVK